MRTCYPTRSQCNRQEQQQAGTRVNNDSHQVSGERDDAVMDCMYASKADPRQSLTRTDERQHRLSRRTRAVSRQGHAP